jgi:hypothetical protein
MSSSVRSRIIIFILVPAAIISIFFLMGSISYLKYTRGIYGFLIFILFVDLAVGFRGKWRDAATLIAVLFGALSTLELACAAFAPPSSVETRGFSTSRPVIGWGPKEPGVYHGEKTGAGGVPIYAADYTIDDHLLRRTLSGSAGSTVAFFGDSMTFGQGLADAATLPQVFADLTGRERRVLNFGFPGYGPQQFLRSMETGLFDQLLSDAKTFVFLTAAWHVERAACLASFVARAPRYDLRDGEPMFVGACAEGPLRAWQDAVVGSATYHRFVEPFVTAVHADDVELYLAELRRSAEFVKQKYGARMIVLYLSEGENYLARSGFTDAKIEESLRESGIEVVNASLSPQNFPPGTEFRIPGDGHPTAVANRARAALLMDVLSHSGTTVLASPGVQ